jgi:hypothetical protein
MLRYFWLLFLTFLTLGMDGAATRVSADNTSAGNWPAWRGPTADNHAPAACKVPLHWTETDSVLWRTPIPGRGHSSPIVVGERVYLTTANPEQQTQSALAFNRQTGQLLQEVIIHRGHLPADTHKKNTHATPTLSSDGQRLFAVFHQDDAIWASGLDRDCQPLWQQRVAEFLPQMYKFGYGASPLLHAGLLIVTSEYDGPDSGIYAFDAASGKPRWKAVRPHSLSFSSPIVTVLQGTEQLLISGYAKVASFDPQSGKSNWAVPATTLATCGTVVWGGDYIYASGGFPVPGTFAVHVTESPRVVWSKPVKCYEQSLLSADGHVYAISDRGVAYCWQATDGKQMWKKRLGGKFSSSPLLVGDRILVSSESGTTYVFRASPEKFELLSENRLGDEIFATPAVAGNRLYLRYATHEGEQRQEYLICIGEKLEQTD